MKHTARQQLPCTRFNDPTMSKDSETEFEVAEINGGVPDNVPTKWARLRSAIREPAAEFFGVFTLITFGDGVVAQVVLSKGEKGGYQSINWGYKLLHLG